MYGSSFYLSDLVKMLFTSYQMKMLNESAKRFVFIIMTTHLGEMKKKKKKKKVDKTVTKTIIYLFEIVALYPFQVL